MKSLKFLPLLLALSVPAWAEIPSFSMPDIIIYADKQTNADTNVNVQQINIGAAKTVPELLRSTAGIQIQSRPNAGGNEDLTVKLRGHDSRHRAQEVRQGHHVPPRGHRPVQVRGMEADRLS